MLGVVGPMLLATGMYKLQFWVPEGRSYHGELIGNGQTRADLGVQAVDVWMQGKKEHPGRGVGKTAQRGLQGR